MANSKLSVPTYCEYATVNTAPTPAGYFTNSVYPRRDKITKLFFSIRETDQDSSPSVVTVKLQFQCAHDVDWTDYLPLDGSSFAIGNRVQVDDFGNGVAWRAGVVDSSAYTSGSVTFGFDW
jgi:hypothetical protein